jgi:hypothetical protein
MMQLRVRLCNEEIDRLVAPTLPPVELAHP